MTGFRALKPEEVECRVSQVANYGVQLLLYKTARTDMALLDEVMGPESWQSDFKEIDGKLFCGIGCKFGEEWVWKWDTGTPSNMEAEKGEASDARKRAGFCWGIGRELYTAPTIWVKRDQCRKIKKGRNGKEQCYDRFEVTKMKVANGRIAELEVCNMSADGARVFTMAKKARKPAAKEPEKAPANDVLKIAYQRMGEAIEKWCERHGCDSPEQIQAKKDGIKKRKEWKSQCKSLEYINSITREFEDD